MSKIVDLLFIDPQVDFCNPNGALFVAGADEDVKRAAKMVKRIRNKINDIHVTLDSHHTFDIAHPIYWKDSSGKHPNPFTIITAKDVENGVWTTTIPSLYKRSLEYVKTLENNGRYPLCVWPPHCLIGSNGHAVAPELFDVFKECETENIAMVDDVTKGSNIYTEHYSAIQADVPDPEDPSTQINTRLVETLSKADIVAVLGEALSHCVAHTLTDIIDNFADVSYAKKIWLVTDAMSSVTGFEKLGNDFLDKMKSLGVQFTTTTEFLK
jgi:nicotinamidase-related amidase